MTAWMLCKGRASPGTRDAEAGAHGCWELGAMPKEWSDKRDRQYEHIRESYKERGVKTDEAEERAADRQQGAQREGRDEIGPE